MTVIWGSLLGFAVLVVVLMALSFWVNRGDAEDKAELEQDEQEREDEESK